MTALALVAAVVVAAAGSARAGILAEATTVANWRGSAVASSSDPGGKLLTVLVEYAVFLPGQYALGADPSGGIGYVYACQAFNDAASDTGFGMLSIGIRPDAAAANVGYESAYGGLVPGFCGAGPSSVYWTFWTSPSPGPEVDPGESSAVLLFASPNPPHLGQRLVRRQRHVGRDAASQPHRGASDRRPADAWRRGACSGTVRAQGAA